MLKLPMLSPAQIAQALIKNMDLGTPPAGVARQLASIPGVRRFAESATVETLWETLMSDERSRAVIGGRAKELRAYVSDILEASRKAMQ